MLTSKKEKLIFTILHEGVKKSEKIELLLPQQWIYEVEGKTSYIVENIEKNAKSVIFETELNPGLNQFTLKGSN